MPKFGKKIQVLWKREKNVFVFVVLHAYFYCFLLFSSVCQKFSNFFYFTHFITVFLKILNFWILDCFYQFLLTIIKNIFSDQCQLWVQIEPYKYFIWRIWHVEWRKEYHSSNLVAISWSYDENLSFCWTGTEILEKLVFDIPFCLPSAVAPTLLVSSYGCSTILQCWSDVYNCLL